MHTRITARNFRASQRLQTYASDRLAKLERFYDGITNAHIVLSKSQDNTDGKSAEISLHVYRQFLTAEDTANTHEEAIDHCVERLRRQILRYKSKLRSTDKNYHR